MKVEEVDLLNLFDNTVVDRYWKLLPLKEKKESKIIILDSIKFSFIFKVRDLKLVNTLKINFRGIFRQNFSLIKEDWESISG